METKVVELIEANAKCVKQIRVLKRVISITDDGLTDEADPRHAGMLLKPLEIHTELQKHARRQDPGDRMQPEAHRGHLGQRQYTEFNCKGAGENAPRGRAGEPRDPGHRRYLAFALLVCEERGCDQP